ncbi:kinase-like domain-containing protein [Hypoxylon argillaceum]|nr:kinase-like domain-containing protein [Hypoxylon argillaceum]
MSPTPSHYIWLGKFIQCRGEKLTNWICKVIFANEGKCIVQFPRGNKVKNPDKRVEIEAATMSLIRQQTEIPIPEVKAWGLASDNILGIGPFIMTTFVEGDKICRQIARFMLQLSQLDFAHISSLSRTSQSNSKYAATIHAWPITWKAHETLNVGGVDLFCSPATTFSARQKYLYWRVLDVLIPRFAIPKYDKGPFKLICDNFVPANMIVNSAEDPTIVAVIDLEWSYAGLLQPFWSCRTLKTWSESDERLAEYNRYLDMYLQILQEEEKAYGGDLLAEHTPSALMRQGRVDGRMWFHHIMWEGFNAAPDFDHLVAKMHQEKADAFVEAKVRDLATYALKLAEKCDGKKA